jgi:hypothetical protein
VLMPKPKRKYYGNPILRARVPRDVHRKMRALAKMYKAPLPEFVRDLFVMMVDPTAAALFNQRLGAGMTEYRQKQLDLSDGSFSAPSKK